MPANEQMNAALDEAKLDLKSMIAQNPAQSPDVIVVAWLHSWYMRAGYKRLCRHLFEVYASQIL